MNPHPLASTIAFASALVGVSAWAMVALLQGLLLDGPDPAGPPTGFEKDRKARLRAASLIYRRAGRLVDRLAARIAIAQPARVARVDRALKAGGQADWNPSESIAVSHIRGAIAGLVVAAACAIAWMDDPVGAIVRGLVVAAVVPTLILRAAKARARRRVATIRDRLPVAIDLLSLVLKAGSSFQDGLGVVVRVMAGHPIADEFGLVIRDIHLGIPRPEALGALADRLGLDVLADLVASLIRQEAAGTETAEILANQADQIRLRQAQWLEQAVGKAEVLMIYPGLIAMLACLIIVLAPFLLTAVHSGAIPFD